MVQNRVAPNMRQVWLSPQQESEDTLIKRSLEPQSDGNRLSNRSKQFCMFIAPARWYICATEDRGHELPIGGSPFRVIPSPFLKSADTSSDFDRIAPFSQDMAGELSTDTVPLRRHSLMKGSSVGKYVAGAYIYHRQDQERQQRLAASPWNLEVRKTFLLPDEISGVPYAKGLQEEAIAYRKPTHPEVLKFADGIQGKAPSKSTVNDAQSIVEAVLAKNLKKDFEYDETDGTFTFEFRMLNEHLVTGELSAEGELDVDLYDDLNASPSGRLRDLWVGSLTNVEELLSQI